MNEILENIKDRPAREKAWMYLDEVSRTMTFEEMVKKIETDLKEDKDNKVMIRVDKILNNNFEIWRKIVSERKNKTS